MLLYAIVYGSIVWYFSDNPGAGHEYYLPLQIYFLSEHIYLSMLLFMTFAFIVVFYRFPEKNHVLRRASIVLAPWFVLFMIGGWPRELRTAFEVLPLVLLLAIELDGPDGARRCVAGGHQSRARDRGPASRVDRARLMAAEAAAVDMLDAQGSPQAQAVPEGQAAAERPLVVDLDGTLIRTDVLVEAFFILLVARPWRALAALRGGRAAFKAAVAAEVVLDVDALPFNEEMLAFLRAEKARGRPIYLASAADVGYAKTIADRLGLFDGVFATEAGHNLKGAAKAKALCDAFGRGGFDYAGNSSADLEVWKAAGGVIVVSASPGLIRTALARVP